MALWLLVAVISTNSLVAGDAGLNWTKPERAVRQGMAAAVAAARHYNWLCGM
jgi:hypothetical protein